MPLINDIQRFDSGSGTLATTPEGNLSRNVQLRFLVHSQAGYQEAETKGGELAKQFYSGHKRTDLRCNSVGAGWYEIEATYENAAILQRTNNLARVEQTPDGFDMVAGGLSFDTTGATERVYQAWTDSPNATAYQSAYTLDGQGGLSPDHWDTHGALNVNENSVQGADITVPAFQFSETWSIPSEYLFGRTPSSSQTPYIKTLYDMTGTVNLRKWRIFEPGELLFMGARGDVQPGAAMVVVTFQFSARANRSNFTVGNIQVASKAGWDLLWVEYAAKEEQSKLLRFPKLVFVDRLYERKDFSLLQLGTAWKRIYLRPNTANTGAFVHPLDPKEAEL
jgi:hypothetical protein